MQANEVHRMTNDPHITRPAVAELVSQLIIATARNHHHALPDPETAQFIINECWSRTKGLRRSDEDTILDVVLGEMVAHLPWMNEGATVNPLEGVPKADTATAMTIVSHETVPNAGNSE